MKVEMLVNQYGFFRRKFAKNSQPAFFSFPLPLFSSQMTNMWKGSETPTRDFLPHFS